MIDAEEVKNAIVQLMVFIKQSKEALAPVESKLLAIDSQKKPLEEQVRKEEEIKKQQALANNLPFEPVLNPELKKLQDEYAALDQKRTRILTEISEAEMEIEKNKQSLTRKENPNIKAQELLSNLKGFEENADRLVTGKKEMTQTELSEELQKLKEKKGK